MEIESETFRSRKQIEAVKRAVNCRTMKERQQKITMVKRYLFWAGTQIKESCERIPQECRGHLHPCGGPAIAISCVCGDLRLSKCSANVARSARSICSAKYTVGNISYPNPRNGGTHLDCATTLRRHGLVDGVHPLEMGVPSSYKQHRVDTRHNQC